MYPFSVCFGRGKQFIFLSELECALFFLSKLFVRGFGFPVEIVQRPCSWLLLSLTSYITCCLGHNQCLRMDVLMQLKFTVYSEFLRFYSMSVFCSQSYQGLNTSVFLSPQALLGCHSSNLRTFFSLDILVHTYEVNSYM